MQVGDVATWVSAIGTISAVIVALYLAGRDGRRRDRSESRRQAELITAWIGGLHRQEGEAGNRRFVIPVSLQNASNQLVYRVVVSVVNDLRGDSRHASWRDALRTFRNRRRWKIASFRTDLATAFGYRSFMQDLPDAFRRGMDAATAAYKFRTFIGELPPGTTNIAMDYPGGGMQFRAAIEITFRDASGRAWLRESTGHLTQLRSDDPLAHYQTRYPLYEPLDWEYPGRMMQKLSGDD